MHQTENMQRVVQISVSVKKNGPGSVGSVASSQAPLLPSTSMLQGVTDVMSNLVGNGELRLLRVLLFLAKSVCRVQSKEHLRSGWD